MTGILDSVLGLIGNTPLVRLQGMESSGSARVLLKLENLNPGGSIKDRVALAMIEDAEARGVLTPGKTPAMTVVEATGGNMGVALALVAAAKGYQAAIVMPENVPVERRRLIERFGATLHLTPSDLGMPGANRAAKRMEKRHKDHLSLDQFANPANASAHRLNTGPEIISATGGRVDVFVAGVGPGGTVTGVGQALKLANPSVKVVAVEPASSPLLSQGRSGEHGIPGLGADFIPSVLDMEVVDEVVTVATKDAVDTTLELARRHGLLVGISSGANVFAAIQVAGGLAEDKVVVTVLPDTGERYQTIQAPD